MTTITGCDSIITTDVIVNSLPTVDLGTDTVIISFSNTPIILDAGAGYNYFWSTGDTSQTILAYTTGWYKVTVSNSCGSATDSTYLEVITSISDPSSSVHFKAYANGDKLYIQGNNQHLIEVYNLTGERVIQLIDNNSSVLVDISMFSHGVYIAKVGEYVIKFIK